jgi:hypothetical protein
MKGCICFEQSLSCTDLCPCQAGDLCRNGTNPFLYSHPNSTADFIGGFATWAVIQIFICSEDFFIQSPSISLNKTVVIKTMISDKTVFHFQHCDTGTCFIQTIYAPSSSLLQGKFASTNNVLQKIRRHLAFEINWN